MVTCTIISKCVGVDASGNKFGIREGTEVEYVCHLPGGDVKIRHVGIEMVVDPSTTDIS